MARPDRAVWAEMRAALRPEDDARVHAAEIDEMLARDGVWGFVAEAGADGAVGFAEVAIRPYANGCDSRPVPFLEGIWVRPAFRRRGIGKRLVEHVEAFLLAQGHVEIGSDTQLDNRTSQAAHRGWGFGETERVVYFRKRLAPP
ncbi:MAG TPA: GNAT family N-acetyltransferase [Stellaceae bacterium]|nr:GNAT family N-acetyltransferase [Stellaceae bacterium]